MMSIEQTLTHIEQQIVMAEIMATKTLEDENLSFRDRQRNMDCYQMAGRTLQALKKTIEEG